MNNKALIAMSGGVDSSVAAYLMKEKGFDCTGATMKLYGADTLGISDEHSCCTLSDIEDAKKVCDSLGILHTVLDFSQKFKEKVIDNFIYAYENGATPNPCIECNRHLKFATLFEEAESSGCDYVVTGHYVRTCYDEKSGRYLLKKALDASKDQSYVLYSLTQNQLAHAIFPLGGMEKSKVRELAEQCSFINASKKDSQDICFVEDDYADFIESVTNKTYPSGSFIDKDGNVLGMHKGIIRYTVGQRKGLGLSFEHPMYVTKVDKENNTVILGPHEELFSSSLVADDVNLISVNEIKEPMRVKAKVRYRQPEQSATITQISPTRVSVKFDEPQRAITKGQAVVFYDGDTVVGGGTITETNK